jgi:hypothetical protein
VQFADGRKATNLDRPPSYDPEQEPDRPVPLQQGGGVAVPAPHGRWSIGCGRCSGDQAAPANFSRSTKVNWPVVGAIGGAGFQAAFRYR